MVFRWGSIKYYKEFDLQFVQEAINETLWERKISVLRAQFNQIPSLFKSRTSHISFCSTISHFIFIFLFITCPALARHGTNFDLYRNAYLINSFPLKQELGKNLFYFFSFKIGIINRYTVDFLIVPSLFFAFNLYTCQRNFRLIDKIKLKSIMVIQMLFLGNRDWFVQIASLIKTSLEKIFVKLWKIMTILNI